MYLNIRGIKTKLESLYEKVEEIQPTLICINETHLMEDDELEIEGYRFIRNDRNSSGGGVLIGIREELYNVCTLVERKQEVEESLWIVIDNSRIKLRIGVIYAPQESRTSKETLKEMYKSIEEQVIAARGKDQQVLLVGDFNCKTGEVVKGNTKEVSKGGKLLLNMVNHHKLTILNSTEKCHGIWTREEGNSKSVIDYIIADKDGESALLEMKIDEKKELAPASIGYGAMSDHNVITAIFNWVVIGTEKAKHRRTIVTRKGYESIRKEMKETQVSRWVNNGPDLQADYDIWKKKVNEIKEKYSTTMKKKNPRRNIKELIKTKRRLKDLAKKTKNRKKNIFKMKMIDEKIQVEQAKQYKNKIETVVESLRSKKGINGPNMWKVVKSLKRKKDEPPTAIKSKEGKILEDPESIKERYLEHFKEILKPAEAITEEEKEQEEIINLAFQNIMDIASIQPTVMTTDDEVKKAIKELKKKKCKDAEGWVNELIIYGGEEMSKSLRIFFNRVETEKKSPQQWSEVLIKTVPKPGSVLDMNNKRGLFLTEVVSKLYEKIIKNRNESKVNKYITEFQTGGKKGTATVDNHIILSEVLRKNRKMGKKTYIVYGDAVKCFDKLWLLDSLVEMYNAGISAQDIKMMHLLNKDTEVTVITPSGKTERLKVGEVVKQGTVLGPTLCCVVTDQVNSVAPEQTGNVSNQRIGILVFVDDVMSAGNADSARKCIRSLKEMETKKKFTFGLKKTNYMIIDTGKEVAEEINEEVKQGKIPETDEYKYVGLWLNKAGNCEMQIEKKSQEVKGEVAALKGLANYYNTGDTYVNVRLKQYEACIIPSLLYNLEGWNRLSRKELKELEKIQATTLCTLLQLPSTTPYLGLLNELGIWKIEERLMYRKIMLFHNIYNSPESRLVKRVVMEQEKSEENDTFYADVEDMAGNLNINMEIVKELTKSQLKKLVKRQIDSKMMNLVRKETETMKKMRFTFDEKDEEFCTKPYILKMGGTEAIQVLKTRLNLLPIYGNFKGDVYLRRICTHCKENDDTTEHLVECRVFSSKNINSSHLQNSYNIQLWKQVNEIISSNLRLRGDKPGEGQFRYEKRSRTKLHRRRDEPVLSEG